MLKFTQFFDNLGKRDKIAMVIGCILLLLYFLYLILSKTYNYKINTVATLIEKENNLVWLEDIKHNINTNEKKIFNFTGTKLLVAIDNDLKKSQLNSFAYQLQQTPNGEIQLIFKTVPFNKFMNWLWTLGEKYKIDVIDFQGKKTSVSGIISLSIIIK